MWMQYTYFIRIRLLLTVEFIEYFKLPRWNLFYYKYFLTYYNSEQQMHTILLKS
jgi:hypothetical protein